MLHITKFWAAGLAHIIVVAAGMQIQHDTSDKICAQQFIACVGVTWKQRLSVYISLAYGATPNFPYAIFQ